MGRARGANAQLCLGYESSYGVPPTSNFHKLPFITAQLGEEQSLIKNDLLGYGREPQAPARDVINNKGNAKVPIDLRAFGYWLALTFGLPTTTAGIAATGNFVFSALPVNNATVTIGAAPWTFVSSGATGDKSLIAATLFDTLTAAVQGLNASATTALASQSYTLDPTGTIITVTSKTIGTAGNSVTLAASSTPTSNATASGATLAGGAATGAFNHVFTSGGLTLPSASIEIGNPDVPKYGMNFGAVSSRLSIPLQRSGLLEATIDLIAQGETIITTTQAGTPTQPTIARFSQFSGQVLRGGAPLASVISGTCSYDNGLDPVEVIRADGRIAGADPGMIDIASDITVRFQDLVLLNLAINGTPTDLTFGWTLGANQSLTIVQHAVYLPKVQVPISKPGGLEAKFSLSGANNPTVGRSMTVTLVNDVSSYAS